MKKQATLTSEQQAVKAALEYAKALHPHPLEGLDLEEIELSEDGKHWLVTIGFWQPKPRSAIDKELDKMHYGLVLRIPSSEVERTYRVVKVDAKTGRAISMKIREQ